MAVPNTDDLADALLKMARGEITLDDEPAGNSAFGETLIDTPTSAPAAADTAQLPAGVEIPRPLRPAAPQRRPAAPLPPPPMPAATADEPLVAEAIDDTGGAGATARPMIADVAPLDGSLAPGSDLAALARAGEVFTPPSASGPARVPRQPLYQSNEFRRTLIPVLLVSGLLLIVLAISCYCVRPESPLTGLPPWMPPILFLAGGALLALTVLNMLSVRAGHASRGVR